LNDSLIEQLPSKPDADAGTDNGDDQRRNRTICPEPDQAEDPASDKTAKDTEKNVLDPTCLLMHDSGCYTTSNRSKYNTPDKTHVISSYAACSVSEANALMQSKIRTNSVEKILLTKYLHILFLCFDFFSDNLVFYFFHCRSYLCTFPELFFQLVYFLFEFFHQIKQLKAVTLKAKHIPLMEKRSKVCFHLFYTHSSSCSPQERIITQNADIKKAVTRYRKWIEKVRHQCTTEGSILDMLQHPVNAMAFLSPALTSSR
jgi:hypothetical protein